MRKIWRATIWKFHSLVKFLWVPLQNKWSLIHIRDQISLLPLFKVTFPLTESNSIWPINKEWKHLCRWHHGMGKKFSTIKALTFRGQVSVVLKSRFLIYFLTRVCLVFKNLAHTKELCKRYICPYQWISSPQKMADLTTIFVFCVVFVFCLKKKWTDS